MMDYLISPEAFDALSRAARDGRAPTAQEMISYTAQAAGRGGVRAGSDIQVTGILTKSPDLLARLFGGGNTVYGDIITALDDARSDSTVDSVTMHVDSPGGTVDGLFETLQAVERFRSSGKKINVRAARAESAAYAIAAASGKIEATTKAAAFGSVGVAASLFVSDRIVDLTNTDSPAKRPDVRTDAGKAVVRERLDAIHELFVDAIAQGRGTDSARVMRDFGRGATLLAGEAQRRGMIDSIASPFSAAPGSQMAAAQRLVERMDAIRSGQYPQRPSESDAEYSRRMAAESQGVEYLPADGRARDLTDDVVAVLEEMRGGATVPERPVPAPARPAHRDLGDEVADALDELRGRPAPAPTPKSKQAPARPEPKDLTDQIVDILTGVTS